MAVAGLKAVVATALIPTDAKPMANEYTKRFSIRSLFASLATARSMGILIPPAGCIKFS